MPNPGSYSNDDALPLAALLARGRDRSWRAHSRCRTAEGDNKRAWVVEPSKFITLSDGRRIKGEELVDMALKICHTCPVQWDCAKWAIEVGEAAGTWAMHPYMLDWLKKQGEQRAVIVIEAARTRSVPVQVAVARMREVA